MDEQRRTPMPTEDDSMVDDSLKRLGADLRTRREAAGLSLRDVEEAGSVSKSAISDAELGKRITPTVLAACIKGTGGDEDEVARWVGRLDRITGQNDGPTVHSAQTAIAMAPGTAVGQDTHAALRPQEDERPVTGQAVAGKAVVASPFEQAAPGNSEHSSVPEDEPGPTAQPATAQAPPDDTSQHSEAANAVTTDRPKNHRKAYIYAAGVAALAVALAAGIIVAKLSNQEGASATSPSTTAESAHASAAITPPSNHWTYGSYHTLSQTFPVNSSTAGGKVTGTITWTPGFPGNSDGPHGVNLEITDTTKDGHSVVAEMKYEAATVVVNGASQWKTYWSYVGRASAGVNTSAYWLGTTNQGITVRDVHVRACVMEGNTEVGCGSYS